MNTEVRADDIYRVRLRSRLKKTLETALRDPALIPRGQRPRPLRDGDGSYSAVLFVAGSTLARLRQRSDLTVAEPRCISAQLRKSPCMTIDADPDADGIPPPSAACSESPSVG